MSVLSERLDRYERELQRLHDELDELRRLVAAEDAAPEPAAPEMPLWELFTAEPEPIPEPEPVKPFPLAPERRDVDLSALLGPRALAWTGGAVMLLGIVFFFVLAAERGWIGHGARVTLGLIASSACIGAGLWLRRRFGDTYASVSAAGVGIAGLDATLLAAAALYDLVSRPVALVLAGLVAGVGAALAVRWGSQTLATLGLLGANLVPLPIALQDGRLSSTEIAFAALVFVATTLVTVPRRWHALYVSSFAVTTLSALALAIDHHDYVVVGAVWLAAAAGPIWASLRRRLEYVPATLLVLGAAYGGWSSALLWGGAPRGVALLGVAAVYGAGSVALFRRSRDLASLLWAIALALAAVGAASLTSDVTLTIVWAAEAAVLAWLARRIDEERFQLAALIWLALAYAHGLASDAPFSKLFEANTDTGVAALSATALAVATALVALCTFEREPRTEPSWLTPIFDRLRTAQTFMRVDGAWLAGGCALYAASLAVVTIPSSWGWGHVAVAAVWSTAAVGLGLLGLRTPARVVGAAAATLVVAYDVRWIDEVPRSWAFAVVASALLVVAVLDDRRSTAAIEWPSIVALTASVLLATASVAELLDGRLRGVGLLALAVAYGAVGVAVLRRRNFASASGVAALALAVPSAAILISGAWLVLAFAAMCAALALLTDVEERLVYGAVSYFGLAFAHTLVFEAQPADLFVAHRHPGIGAPAVALVLVAGSVLATRSRDLRPALTWVCGGLGLYAATLVILEAFEATGGSIDTSFQRGHTAVSACWGIVGLTLLVTGLKHAQRRLRIGGLVLFGLSLAKLFVYDLAFLSSIARALSFLAVGALILLGAFFYQRLTGPDLHSPA